LSVTISAPRLVSLAASLRMSGVSMSRCIRFLVILVSSTRCRSSLGPAPSGG
jgi:hypothetical protein